MDHLDWCFDDLVDGLRDESEPREPTENGIHPILKAARTPRDIAHWRRRLFYPKDGVTLSAHEFQLIWPYCDNYWTFNREEQKHVYYRCRVWRPENNRSVKTAEPENQRQRQSTRNVFGCPCKITVTPVRSEHPSGTEVTAYQVDVFRGTEHNHSAEDIEPIKVNTAVMAIAGRLVTYDIPPQVVRRSLLSDHDLIAQQHFFDAGGKWLSLQAVKNASRQLHKLCPGAQDVFRTRRSRIAPSAPATAAQELDDFFLGPRISTEPSPRPSEDLEIVGKYVTLKSLSKDHMPSLWRNLDNSVYNFLPMLRHSSPDGLWHVLKGLSERGMVLYAINADLNCLSPAQPPLNAAARTETIGTVAFLDIQPEHRALEVGAVLYGPALRRTAAATEAQYLLLLYAFGQASTPLAPPYRRVVWKCNQRNPASRRAAERLGFSYEGEN
jgi:RimJ/RimL family protein N-acetyltransferase